MSLLSKTEYSVKAYATVPIGIMGRESLALIDRGSRCLKEKKQEKRMHKYICLCCLRR